MFYVDIFLKIDGCEQGGPLFFWGGGGMCVLGGCFFQEPGFVLLLELYANLDTADEINTCIYDILNYRNTSSTVSCHCLVPNGCY
jgi:hypothetical protein